MSTQPEPAQEPTRSRLDGPSSAVIPDRPDDAVYHRVVEAHEPGVVSPDGGEVSADGAPAVAALVSQPPHPSDTATGRTGRTVGPSIEGVGALAAPSGHANSVTHTVNRRYIQTAAGRDALSFLSPEYSPNEEWERAILAIEQEATAAARAEVARQMVPVVAFLRGVAKVNAGANGIIAYIEQDLGYRDSSWRVHNHAPDEGIGVGCREYRLNERLIGSCLIAVLEDAAPRQPEPETRAVKPKPGLRGPTLNELRDRAEAAGITYWDDEWTRRDFIDALSVAPDTTTGTTDA